MKSQSGNALFLILIAVALFAALSYAITSSGRGVGNTSKEQSEIAASQVIQYFEVINQTFQRMRLLNGCGESEYNFETPIYTTNAGNQMNQNNANSPTDGSCDIFGSSVGVVAQPLPDAALDLNNVEVTDTGTYPNAWRAGHLRVVVTQLSTIGTDGSAGDESANDLMLISNYLNKDTCMAINRGLGVDNPIGDAPIVTASGASSFYVNGSFANGHVWTGVPGMAFCRKAGSANVVYQLVYVLMAR